MASSRNVIIAGAGIGGLTASLMLAQAGFRVTLLEQAAKLSELGAGIQLSPNATHILIALGLGERLRSAVFAPESVAIKTASGGSLARIPLGGEVERRYSAPYWSIHRADLQSALLEAVQANPDIVLRLNTRVEDFIEHANGLSVACRYGTATADEQGIALIAADGLWSALRTRLGHPAGIRPAHRLACAGRGGRGRGGTPHAGRTALARPQCARGPLPGPQRHADQRRRHRRRRLVGARLERRRPARAIARPLLAVELGAAGPRVSRRARALAEVGAVRLAPAASVGRRPGDAARGRCPPDAAFPRARRLHGDRGCRHSRRLHGERARRSHLRDAPLRAHAAQAHREGAARCPQQWARLPPRLGRGAGGATFVLRLAGGKMLLRRYNWLYDWRTPPPRSAARLTPLPRAGTDKD